MGVGGHRGTVGGKNSPNGVILVAEPGGEGELSEASWEPGAQRRGPGCLMRVNP